MCGAGGTALCTGCWRQLRPAPPAAPPPLVDRCRSLLAFEGSGRKLLVGLKYRNERSIVRWLTTSMAALIRPAVVAAGVSVVTWAPTTAARCRERGFDQAEILARGIAGELALPCRGRLRRLPGPAQTGRSRHDRLAGPSFAPSAPAPSAVLLVDDVITTGATLTSAAAALRSAGATSVIAVTAGATPLKVPGRFVDP